MSTESTVRNASLAPSEIEKWRGECFHPARSIGQADLYDLRGPYSGWVLKDFSRRPLWIRLTLTRRVLKREARALESLRDIPGIPRPGGLVGKDAMIMERLSADRLPSHKKENILTPEFFDRLYRLIESIHERGWAHGDLRRKNILVDEDLRPYLIDFATAWSADRGRGGPIMRYLFRRWAHVDLVTVARIKASYLPEDLTAEDRRILSEEPLHLRVGRVLRKKVYRPFKRRHRKRLWRTVKAYFGLRVF